MQGETKSAKTYTATEARAKFSDLCDAAYFGARVHITKRDREVAIVSVKFLDRLLEMEAAIEAKAAKAALDEFQSMGGKTMEQIKLELHMD